MTDMTDMTHYGMDKHLVEIDESKEKENNHAQSSNI